jgi:murein DD-endopeptidase MepM/ murein hydrolase activator NlpD
VVRAFDPPAVPWGKGHRGVDLAGTVGQAVDSALVGRVTFAGSVAGRGVVVVDHGATRTSYQPVAATVHVGETVLAGQQIGTLRLPGSHCFPRACLHWGWLRGDTYLDPLLLVGGGPIVLLPLWRGTPVQPLPLPVSPFAALVTPLLLGRSPKPAPWVTLPGQPFSAQARARPLGSTLM